MELHLINVRHGEKNRIRELSLEFVHKENRLGCVMVQTSVRVVRHHVDLIFAVLLAQCWIMIGLAGPRGTDNEVYRDVALRGDLSAPFIEKRLPNHGGIAVIRKALSQNLVRRFAIVQ